MCLKANRKMREKGVKISRIKVEKLFFVKEKFEWKIDEQKWSSRGNEKENWLLFKCRDKRRTVKQTQKYRKDSQKQKGEQRRRQSLFERGFAQVICITCNVRGQQNSGGQLSVSRIAATDLFTPVKLTHFLPTFYTSKAMSYFSTYLIRNVLVATFSNPLLISTTYVLFCYHFSLLDTILVTLWNVNYSERNNCYIERSEASVQ